MVAKALKRTLLGCMVLGLTGAGWAADQTTNVRSMAQSPIEYGYTYVGQGDVQKQQTSETKRHIWETKRHAADRAERERSDAAERMGTETHSITQTRLNAMLPAGITQKDARAANAATEAIRDVFETTANGAVNNDLNKVIEQFSAPDRDRLGQSREAEYDAALKEAGEKFRSAWNDRYRTEFEIDLEDEVFGPSMAVSVGEIKDASQLSWPLNPVFSREGGTAMDQGEKNYLKPGRDVAVAVLPATSGLPELTVSFVHEAPDFWKIDIPDSVDRATIARNLTSTLNQLSQKINTFPENKYLSNRLVSHQILLGLYNVGSERY